MIAQWYLHICIHKYTADSCDIFKDNCGEIAQILTTTKYAVWLF